MAALPALGRGDTAYLIIERLNVMITEYNARTPLVVATLPDATLNAGARRVVTDATVTTFATVVVGGGANQVPVYADNAGNWRIG